MIAPRSYIRFFAKESSIAFAAFSGDSDLVSSNSSCFVVKESTRIRSKELIHRDTDPVRTIYLLRKLSKKGF